MTALLFGSASTLADTSELQREAFNAAFAQHGLDWEWGTDDYRSMLEGNGGQDRIASYAEQRGVEVDAAAVHQTKSELFQERLRSGGVPAREGVVETIRDARARGFKVALVTTTSPDNVAALGQALAGEVSFADDLDLILDKTQVDRPKPDAEAYAVALSRLGEDAAACVAVEDNQGGVASAVAAGVACVAFPNANTAGHDFDHASLRVDRLDLTELTALTTVG